MTFYSLPFTPERVEATEARLEAIYEAAKYGLKGDSLAIKAGLTPAQYRRLHEFDPLVEMAEMKGRADAEGDLATTLMAAALEGDTKVALEVLKHRHDWQATQKVQVDVAQQISITAALEQAEKRVLSAVEDAKIIEPRHRANGAEALTHQPVTEVSDGYQQSNASAAERVAVLRP